MEKIKSWYDLTKDEQKSLRKEFSLKRKVIDLRIIFYLLSFVAFFPIVALVISMINNACYGDACIKNICIFGIIFLFFFILGIMNSVLLSKNQKEFISWLKNKNIDKI